MSWLFELDKVNDWAYWDNAFSPEECKKIIDFCIKLGITIRPMRLFLVRLLVVG